MQCGTYQDLAARGAVAITRRPVGRFADDRQLHALVRADKPMQHLAAVNTDADRAGDLPLTLAPFADFRYRRLHGQRRSYRLFVPHLVRLRAAEYGEDGVSGDFVDRAVMLKN